MEHEEEIKITEILDMSNVYEQQERGTLDTQIVTAKKFPRDLERVVKNCSMIVTMDQETAESCNYSVPRGGKSIQGPSVYLARIIVQQYGNMRVEAKVVDIGPRQLTSEAVCFDLESNIAIKAQVKRSIMQNEWKNGKKTGKMVRMNDDMITVTGNAANAIAFRNAVFGVIPRAIINKLYKEAQQKMIGDVSTSEKLIARATKVFDALKKAYKVTDEEILKYVAKTKIEDVTSEDIVNLIGIGTSIKTGDTTVESAFRPSAGGPPTKEDIAKKKEDLGKKPETQAPEMP